MKFKERWKRFWTLDRYHAEGFTLVELIVVIAILAILGGVAVPAYSGYVQKANEAADQQLLAAVNTAFAAACVENGTDTYNLPAQPELKRTADKAVDEVTPYASDFDQYFAGNEDAVFKTDSAIVFDVLRGAFVLMVEGETVSLRYGDNGYITLSAKDIANLADSTFNTAEGLGIEGLLEKVNDVSIFAAALDGSASYNKVLEDPEYMRSFLSYMGIDASGLEGRALSLTFGTELGKLSDIKFKELTAGMGELTLEQADPYLRQADSLVKANMAVLHAAQNTSKLSQDQISNLLNSGDPKNAIIGALNGDSGQGLSEAALYYGMYTSFAYSKEYGNSTRQDATKNPLNLLTSLTDTEIKDFKAYVNSDQGKADLDAYISSMNMINSSTGSTDAVKNVLSNGFNDAELSKLIQQTLDK